MTRAESPFGAPKDAAEAELVFEVAQLFFAERARAETLSVKNISEILQSRHRDRKISRESIYPLLGRAFAYGYVRFVPPVDQTLAARVKERYPQAKEVVVVSTRGKDSNDSVGAAAAEVVVGLLANLKQKGFSKVGLGLGPGKSALDFTTSLARALETSPELPQLDLFGITAGCIPTAPEFAPVSFFNLLPRHRVERRMAIWAEALVQADQLDRLKTEVVGVREAFAAKKDIRVVVTGLGDAEDEHDMLRQFYEASPSQLRPSGMIGNVQYRPFSEAGPIRENGRELRAVTLFELEELVSMSREKDRYVILLARQCGLCGKHRARVLRYLLGREDLAVHTHLVMDLATADALLDLPRTHGDSATEHEIGGARKRTRGLGPASHRPQRSVKAK